MTEPAVMDIVIYRGETFSLPMHFEDDNGVVVDISGYAADLQARERAAGPALLNWSTSGSVCMTISGSSLNILAPAATTAALEFRRAEYDLRLTKPDATVEYVAQGELLVEQRVTR